MVGLWCRDNIETALQWRCCPEIQYFPCVAIEVLAGDNKTREDPSRIIKHRRARGAYCVGVPVSTGSSTAEQLLAVTLEAVWVAMPRSHRHLQDVGLLQDMFRRTIEWVVRTAGVEPKENLGRFHCGPDGCLRIQSAAWSGGHMVEKASRWQAPPGYIKIHHEVY